MNEVVYFHDVVFELGMFCVIALVVTSAFLFYELYWRNKHPDAYTSNASQEDKKSSRKRASYFFTFLFLWVFAFLAYIEWRIGDVSPVPLICIGFVCAGGIFMAFGLRR